MRQAGVFEELAASATPAQIWLSLLLLMAWPCAWYYRKKRERPNFITRYF